jgi:putative membrane protein
MALLFASLIALIHVYVFFLESFAWGRPRTNKLFRVSEADAHTMKKLAFNQGFYNLFLAIAVVSGLALRLWQHEVQGNTLLDYAALSVFAAGFVLFASDTSLKRPALIQALPALGYLGFRILGY